MTDFEGGKLFSMQTKQEIVAGSSQVAVSSPAEHDQASSMNDWGARVMSYVRVAAQAAPGVSEAFVSKDGRHVVLTAPEWTEERSKIGAQLVVALIRELKPDVAHWIEGGFTEAFVATPDYEQVK